ncbi:MAG TPA: tetratricopeptide repeat protein, partial [Ktedonobacterales bacterium]|nr:tetratricopeptide repeat protein [Ktedonobacterales bacterium]
LLDTTLLNELPAEYDRERLRLHTLLRAFAKSEFAKLPPEVQQNTLQAICAYYADYVPNASKTSKAALDADRANINAAIEWAHAQGKRNLVVQLCVPMADYWGKRWFTRDSLKLLPLGVEAAAAIELQDTTPHNRRITADLRLALARALRRTDKLDEAEKLFTADLAYRQAEGDREGEARVLLRLGEVSRIRGQLGEAENHYKNSLSIWHDLLDHKRLEGLALGYLGRIEYLRANYEKAAAYYEDSLHIAEQQGDLEGVGRVWNSLGQVALARGAMSEAQGYFTAALERLREQGDKPGVGDVLTGMGRLAIDRADFEQANVCLTEALKIDQDIVDFQGDAVDRSLLAQVKLENGEREEARRAFLENVHLRKRAHDPRGEGVDHSFLGRIAMEEWIASKGRPISEQDSLTNARDEYEQALGLAREVGNKRGEGASLNYLGIIAILADNAVEAKQRLDESMRIAANEVHSEPDNARAILSQGLYALRIEHDAKKGQRFFEQAIQRYDKMQRPLDLKRARKMWAEWTEL